MPHSIAKQTDIVLVGDSPLIRLLHRLILENTKNCMLVNAEDFRFLDDNVASINGTKVYAKKIIILKKLHSTLPDIPGLNTVSKKQNPESIIIIGNNERAYKSAVEAVKNNVTTNVITMSDRLLEKYDSSVQDVCERHLKKTGVKLYMSTTILSIATKDGKNYIVTESSGAPKRLVCDDIAYFSDGKWDDADTLGLANTSLTSVMDEIASANTIKLGAQNTLIIPAETSYTLSDLEYVVDFAKDGKYRHGKSLEFYEGAHNNFSYFTVGIKEQDIENEHVAYKKSVAKISVNGYEGPTLFLKVITSLKKNIVGISGIVPRTTDNSLFRYIVECNMNVIEARRLIDATSPLALAFHDITENLS